MSFDPQQWAADVLGCSKREADERIHAATAQLDRDEIVPGDGMGRIRARARMGDRDALKTAREIDIAFAACEQARRTGTPCPHCNH